MDSQLSSQDRATEQGDRPYTTEPDDRQHTTEPEDRQCARVGCAAPAEHTLTADYEERIMAVGPLSPTRTPPAHDLCDRHAEALTPPAGWQLLRYDPDRARSHRATHVAPSDPA